MINIEPDIWIPIVSGFLGAIFGTLMSWRREYKKDQFSSAFEMHKEFYSGDLAVSRNAAHKILTKYPTLHLDDLYNQAPILETQNIWSLLNFYERLWISVKFKRIPPDLAYEIFGNLFVWWFDLHFQKRLKKGVWRSFDALLSLRELFEKNYGHCEYFQKNVQMVALEKIEIYPKKWKDAA